MFIKDINEKQLALHIKRFCILTGMRYDDDAIPLFYPMILNKYGMYEEALLEKSFTKYVENGGKAPQTFAANFLFYVINEYLSENHQNVKRYEVKREYTAKLPSPEEMEKTFQNNLSRCTITWIDVWYSKKMEMLSLMVMNITFKAMVERNIVEDNFDQSEVYQMMDWISNYEQRYIQHLKGLNRNPYAKTIYETLTLVADKNKQDKTLEGAAKFAIYINTKNNI